jgi:hypothetical protein
MLAQLFFERLFSMLQTRHFHGFPRVDFREIFCMGWPALDANPDQQPVSRKRNTRRRERAYLGGSILSREDSVTDQRAGCISNADLPFLSRLRGDFG